MERKKRGERRRERNEEGMRERDRWGSLWVREGGRLKKKERERRGSETDVPKLYPTMNMNSLCWAAGWINASFQGQ